jgi:glycosyltransferase involved in cell wall biosynthesis
VKVLLLCRYGALGASSRVRMYQFLPALRTAGIDVTAAPLIDDARLTARYAAGRYPAGAMLGRYLDRLRRLLRRREFDLLWIEYELFPWLPAIVERLATRGGPPYVVEYDDAVFHQYDSHANAVIRAILGRKHDRLMAAAAAVIAGNDYLAERAEAAGARRIVTLPSVVDTDVFTPADRGAGRPPVIGWIGSPTTATYLGLIADVLAALTASGQARVRLVGVESATRAWPFASDQRPWRLETEVADVQSFDIGIMPLPDDRWTRGKCGYKLVQYMACGKPVVASPVGANRDIVRHGVDGCLARSPTDWQTALAGLLGDAARRRAMGESGRARAVESYSRRVVLPRLAAALSDAAG